MKDRTLSSTRLCIWHIAETYPPDYGGGAAIYIRDICRLMAERGHEVRVLCAANGAQTDYTLRTEYDGSVRVDRLNLSYFKTIDPEGWQLGLRRWWKHQRRMAKVIDELLCNWTPDVAHYHTCRPFGEEVLQLLHRRRIPIVGMLHDAWLICSRVMLLRSPTTEACRGPTPLRCLECVYSYYDGTHGRALLKLPWRILKLGSYPAYRLWRRNRNRRHVMAALTYSRFMRKVHAKEIRGEIRYLPLGLDLDGLPASQPSRPRRPLRFGFVAGFQPNKGIWHVLDACAVLKRNGLDFELHVWGPGDDKGYGEIASRRLKDRVYVRGMFTREQRWQVYGEMDVAIMATTVCEPFGRVPMEAAAAGVPTIAPAVGGISETIRDEETGLLYRFMDVCDLERQMRRVLEDPSLVPRLIKKLTIPPSITEMSSAVEAFYLEVVAGSRKAE